jgi:hypothetical protein
VALKPVAVPVLRDCHRLISMIPLGFKKTQSDLIKPNQGNIP